MNDSSGLLKSLFIRIVENSSAIITVSDVDVIHESCQVIKEIIGVTTFFC